MTVARRTEEPITAAFLRSVGYPLARELADGRWLVLVPQLTNAALAIVREASGRSEQW